MRRRQTFSDRHTFDVRSAGELLFYGPHTAVAVDMARQIHTDIIEDCERAQIELRERMAELRLRQKSRQDAIRIVKRTDPELWSRVYCAYQLDRVGINCIRESAEADTTELLKALYAGKPVPFTPCETPLAAWRRYSAVA